jgi:hypothetical protein
MPNRPTCLSLWRLRRSVDSSSSSHQRPTSIVGLKVLVVVRIGGVVLGRWGCWLLARVQQVVNRWLVAVGLVAGVE